MNTDELVNKLSAQPSKPRRTGATVTILVASGFGLMAALAFSLLLPQTQGAALQASAAHDRALLLKLVFTFGIVAAVCPIVRDLAVPGRRLGWTSFLAAAPFAIIIAFAARELALVPAEEWSHRITEFHWADCLWQIPAFAFPALIILMIGLRRLAPVHLVQAGAYVGLLAGAMGSVGYALHCHDDSIAFVAIAYTLAMTEVVIIGAVIGPHLLRWR